LNQPYTYIYHDERMIPYYVGECSRRRFVATHPEADHGGEGIPVPPEARILVQHWESQAKANEMEEWWINLYGRRDLGTGCLMNKKDGGPGCKNCPPQREAAREVGRKVVESGHLARMAALGRTPESRAKGGRIGGRIGGRKNAESGQLARIRHIRWHVKRGIVNPDCLLCQGAFSAISSSS